MIRILICDDQEICREGLKIVFKHAIGIEVVGTAQNGKEAVQMAIELEPDVVLMDLQMPVLNGVNATRRITRLIPRIKVIVMTTYDDNDWVSKAILAGAFGYLLKDANKDEIIKAIENAILARSTLDTRVAGVVLNQLKELQGEKYRTETYKSNNFEKLSVRDKEILELLMQGYSNGEMAEQLSLSLGTTKNYISNLKRRLNARNRSELILFAMHNEYRS